MTELEWEAATDPLLMLEFVRGRATERQLRLLGVACARASWDLLEDDRSRRAIEAAERYADGTLGLFEMDIVAQDAWDVRDELWDAGPEYADDRLWLAEGAALTASNVEWQSTFSKPVTFSEYPFRVPTPIHCKLMRDIFGPRFFRASSVIQRWITPAAVAIAEGIYSQQTFDRLPILADALEDSGCDDNELLAHCRNDGTHVKGCWVIDLVLTKC